MRQGIFYSSIDSESSFTTWKWCIMKMNYPKMASNPCSINKYTNTMPPCLLHTYILQLLSKGLKISATSHILTAIMSFISISSPPLQKSVLQYLCYSFYPCQRKYPYFSPNYLHIISCLCWKFNFLNLNYMSIPVSCRASILS